VREIEAARAAWDDLRVICGTTVQNGPRWADRTHLPGLPEGLVEAMNEGFGHRCEPMGQSYAAQRSAAWGDFRRRLRENADAEI
jgi:hypothetical protein